MKKTLTNLDYTPYIYEDEGSHTVRISNSIRSLTLVGNKEGIQNNLKEQLVEVNNIGSKVEELGPYCFDGCSSLQRINIPENVKYYGDECFRRLSTEIDCPVTRGDVVFSLGENAFRDTNISSVTLALSGKGILDPADEENGYQGCRMFSYEEGPYLGNNVFRDCKNLKQVTITQHPDIGTSMFQGCTSLTSVNIQTNYGACVGQHAFADCTSLPSITFPENWEILSENMFENCTTLTAVNFSNSANAKLVSIEDYAFNGCTNLSAITMPKSIVEPSQLMPNSLAGSGIKSITFSGIGNDVLDAYKSQDEKFAVVNQDYSTKSNFKYGIWYLNQCKQVCQFAIKNNIPLVVKFCGVGCGHCSAWNSKVFNTKSFQQETAKRPYIFLEALQNVSDGNPAKWTSENREYILKFHSGYLSQASQNKQKKDIQWSSIVNTFVILCAYWKKPNGSCVAKQWRTSGYDKSMETTKTFFEKLDKWFSGYTRDERFNGSNYTPAQYVAFNGWGLDHNCALYSSEGTRYTYDSAAKIIVKGESSIAAIQEQRNAIFATSDPSSTRVITVALDYVGTGSSNLPGMTCDADDMEAMLTPYSNKITKLVNSQATISNVKNALQEAIDDISCKLLIFHFSGHGSGGSSGKSSMVMSNGSLADSAFWKIIQTAKCRVLCIFACCHAGTMFKSGGSNDTNTLYDQTVDFGRSAKEFFNGQSEDAGICESATPNLLVWSACKDEEVSWMYSTEEVEGGRADGITRTGHSMINHIVGSFTSGMTYKQVWETVPAEEQYFQKNGKAYIYKGKEVFVHPQLTELGRSFQDFTAFT